MSAAPRSNTEEETYRTYKNVFGRVACHKVESLGFTEHAGAVFKSTPPIVEVGGAAWLSEARPRQTRLQYNRL